VLAGLFPAGGCSDDDPGGGGGSAATSRFGPKGAGTAIEESPGFANYEAGKRFAEDGLLQRAAEELFKSTELDPYRVEFLHEFARVLYSLHLGNDARTTLTRAITLDPGDVELRLLAALVEGDARRPQEALKHLRSAVELDGGRHDVHFFLGRTLIYLSDTKVGSRALDEETLDEGIAEIRRAVELLAKEPDDEATKASRAEYSFWLAKGLERKADLDPALEAYETAADLAPEFVEARVRAGALLIARGDAERAKKRLEEALALDPELAEVHEELGYLAKQVEDLPEAKARLQRAAELAPSKPEVHFALASVLRLLGEDEAADAEQKEYEGWMQLQEEYRFWHLQAKTTPDDPEVAVKLGWLSFLQSDHEQAMSWLRRAIDLDPANAKAHADMGAVLADLQQYDVAVQHLQKSIELAPDDVDVLKQLVQVHLAKADLPRAGEAMERVLALAPGDAWTHYNLGVLCLETDRADDALRHFEQAVEADGTYLDARLGLAGMLYERKEWSRAAEEYRKALELDPENADARTYLDLALREGQG